jgi:hypothetical protein
MVAYPLILALRRLKQEDLKIESSLGYRVQDQPELSSETLSQKKNKIQKKKKRL